MKYKIEGLFPCPLYFAHRDSDINVKEFGDVDSIIEEGLHNNKYNSTSNNSYVFDNKFKQIKEFCEQHIKIYVENIINPKEELEFYITQSWLNVTKQGGSHQQHWHPNSIISGVFYISVGKNDGIFFYDPNNKIKEHFKISPTHNNIFNSDTRFLPVIASDLVLFPSWLEHYVASNQNAIKERISIAFNVFAKGIFGDTESLTKLLIR